MKTRVMVVEDDHGLRRTLERCLSREGCEVIEARDGREAVDKLEGGLVTQLIITDLEMPRADGREVLNAGLQRRIPVVILTGHGTVQTAVEMMRRGAANFLTKPFSPASLRALLDDALGHRGTESQPVETASSAKGAVIGQDPLFRQVLGVIEAVAETDATVLITGESGSGKEVVARAIHAASCRALRPFVAVNCGAIPDALLESELFGHAKGAFTGATHARTGRLQLANRGSLFLDEVGDMPLAFQVKLLRVLQERQFEALGDNETRSTDARVIAATHRDLGRMVAEGTFREDLFYRLNVIEVRLPSLRERPSDIPLLVDHFLQTANARHGRSVAGVTPPALQRMVSYRWPGNIRELANVVERMVILKRSGSLEVHDLPSQIQCPSTGTELASDAAEVPLPEAGIDLRQTVAHLEESLIEQALLRTGGNRNAAAQLLRLNRTTLVEKLRRKR